MSAQPATQHDGSICGARPGSGPPFGRKVAGCPRCDELIAGAAPRQLSDHRVAMIESAARRESADAQRCAEIRAHFAPGGAHSRRTCGPVCTFGDW